MIRIVRFTDKSHISIRDSTEKRPLKFPIGKLKMNHCDSRDRWFWWNVFLSQPFAAIGMACDRLSPSIYLGESQFHRDKQSLYDFMIVLIELYAIFTHYHAWFLARQNGTIQLVTRRISQPSDWYGRKIFSLKPLQIIIESNGGYQSKFRPKTTRMKTVLSSEWSRYVDGVKWEFLKANFVRLSPKSSELHWINYVTWA